MALNVDAITTLLAGDPNGGILLNGASTFDSQGRATALFTLPPGVVTFLAGFPMSWTFLAVDPLGQPSCVGDTKQLLLLL